MSIEPVNNVSQTPAIIRHEDNPLPKKKKEREKGKGSDGEEKEKGKIDITV
ncbi:MAG: hypothetical protein M0Z61_11725 [Nitrospiraceae bacterium]|nr:hypothetical protein [Nitrospiraceae bacterium]